MEERTITDFQTVSNRLAGKMFWEYHPSDKNQYRTVRMHLNVFANRVMPQFSNFIVGTPPEGMKQLPPMLLGSLMRFQNSQGNTFF